MEHFIIDHGDMFAKYDTESLFRSRDKQISDAIADLNDDYILNVNEKEFIQYLIDNYTLQYFGKFLPINKNKTIESVLAGSKLH